MDEAGRMTKALSRGTVEQFTLFDHFEFKPTGLKITGRPDFDTYQHVGDFIKAAAKASGFWLADWLRYGETRPDWSERLSQAQDMTGLSEKRLKNIRAIGAMPESVRHPDVDFSLHEEVIGLPPREQRQWLDRAQTEGWSLRDLRLELKTAKRPSIVQGQAILEGQYRVIYADPPWSYGNRQPSGVGAGEHYPTMTYADLRALPVAAHTCANAVLFLWVTAPMLYDEDDQGMPGPFGVIKAWGFTPKTGAVWDKVQHNFGNYFSVRHEHLIVATRGSCTPDHPTPQPDSVIAERPTEHSKKPEIFRKVIERLYDGPYLELFARERAPGWTVFGNDARLWHAQGAA
jgi:N6-adenosine-specific RNA methylase IME4